MSERSILRFINYSSCAMVLIVPLVFVQHMMFPFIIAKAVIFQTLSEIIIFSWLLLSFLKKEHRPSITPVSVALIFFLIYLTISSFLGVDSWISIWSTASRGLGVFALWHFGLLALAVTSMRKAFHWDTLWRVSVLTSALTALGAILAFNSIYFSKFFLTQDTTRPGATFGNPTFLAGYLLFNTFIAIWISLYEKKSWIKYSAVAIAVLDACAIFITQTRGDLIGLFLGLVAIVFLLALRGFSKFSFQKSIVKNIWLWIVLCLLAFLIFFALTRSVLPWEKVPGLGRLSGISSLQTEVRDRLFIWQSGIMAFKDRPIFGWGWENFNVAFEQHYNPRFLKADFGETFWDKPHNVLLEYAVTGGVVGLFAYLALWAAFIYELVLLQDKNLKVILAGLLLAYFFRNLVVFDTIGTYLMFFLVVAFIDSHYILEKKLFHSNDKTEREERPATNALNPALIFAFFIPVALLIYFVNWPTARAMYVEYNGPNYFLLGNNDLSLKAFKDSLSIPNPYQDETRNNFASVVKQAESEGVHFPDIKNLQGDIVKEVEKVVARHPLDYFNYTFLAEFKNQFYQYNSSYLDDADALAKKALELSPGRQQVYYVIAKTALLRGDKDKAIKVFEETVALAPEAGDPHFYLGILGYETHDISLGDQEIARAKELGRIPNTFDEAVALGTLVGDLKEDYKSAAYYYGLALGYPENSSVKRFNTELQLAIALYYDKRPDEARPYFEEVAKNFNLKSTTMYEGLKPIYDDLGISL